MLITTKKSNQPNIFYGSLMDMLDSNDPLIGLADVIDWSFIESSLSNHYSKDNGRPAKPIRLMAGLLILKQLENLSDESVVLQFKRNPYYQYFCGFRDYSASLPCDSTELVKFRNRIGKDGVDVIFRASVNIHGEVANDVRVIIDSTAQEKNITYPTDGKLAIRIINHLHKIAKSEGVALRRTYLKEIKEHRITLRFFRHPKKRTKAASAMKRLRTIAGVLIRDIERNITPDRLSVYQDKLEMFTKVISQKRDDKNKIYSLHESHIYAMAKGKDNKSYEYGTKASIVSTYTNGVIVGAIAHDTNMHDSKTLESAIAHANSVRDNRPIKEAICDRGYRGVREVGNTKICIPATPLKRDSDKELEAKRAKFRRRAAIEPIIGHLKNDYRLARCYLKGFIGDQINLLMAATAWNMKKWMNNFIYALFMAKEYQLALLLYARLEQMILEFVCILYLRLQK